MKTRECFFIILCLIFVLQLFGCQQKDKEKIEEETEETSSICVLLDYDYNSWNSDSMNKIVTQQGVKRTIKASGGPSNIEFKYVPSNGVEREEFLINLRVEIMAGKGPDVFLCSAYTSDNTDGVIEPIFKFPQQAMRNHVFLPLDAYIKDAQFMEWNRLTPVIMDAGNYEGVQYLLPTGYTMYLTYYKGDDFHHKHSKVMTWDEMTNGELELKKAAIGDTSVFCGNIFFPFADFDRDCICFTEAELLDLMKKWKNVFREVSQDKDEKDYFDGCLAVGFENNADRKVFKKDDVLTMVPVYSVQGGYKATVTSFAAINANTKRPEDAFFVVDYWLSEECQSSEVYGYFLRGHGVPSLEGLMTEEKPCDGWSMSKENYDEYCNLRDSIVSADFNTSMDIEFRELLSEVRGNPTASIESLVHKKYMTMQMMIGES